jgi:Cu+-exporting ATPase
MWMPAFTSKAWCSIEPVDHKGMPAAKVLDPVCGMRIEIEKAVASEEYAGSTHHFCSAQCHRLFRAAPERYVGSKPAANHRRSAVGTQGTNE